MDVREFDDILQIKSVLLGAGEMAKQLKAKNVQFFACVRVCLLQNVLLVLEEFHIVYPT